MSALYALIVAIFGGVLPTLDFHEWSERRSGHIARIVIIGVLWFFIAWFFGWKVLPHFVGPWAGMILSAFLFGLVATCIAAFHVSAFPHGGYFVGLYLLFIMITGISGCDAFRAGDYAKMIGKVEEREWSQDMEPVSLSHIIVVCEEQAVWKGNQVLGQDKGALGSRYYVGPYHIQKVRNELYWVATLEFHDWVKWSNFHISPGFIMVSAEDPNREPELIDKYQMVYMPSACFGSKLERYLYEHGYATKGLTDWTFEVDDSLKPWWTVTVWHPSIAWDGPAVDGMVVLNPETGDFKFYKSGDVPDWIDRVYPAGFVSKYIDWHGRYIHDWWNQWIFGGNRDVEIPTGIGIWMVYGSDRNPYWFTGLTSISNKDKALTGFMMVCSRTGKAYRYQLAGANEEAVLNSVNTAVSNYEGWRGTHPTLLNIYGHLTWVVPVIGATHVLTKVALVNAQNAAKVVLGDDIHDAAQQYRNYLATLGSAYAMTNDAQTSTVSGRVSRIHVEPSSKGAIYYFMLRGELARIFMGVNQPSAVSLPITEVGDSVTISFVDTKESQVPIQGITNHNLRLAPSFEQRGLELRRDTVLGDRQNRDDVRDVQQQLRDPSQLTPEQVRRVKEVLKQPQPGGK